MNDDRLELNLDKAPPNAIEFSYDGQTYGRLIFEDGKIKFKGIVDVAAKIFFNEVIAKTNAKIKELEEEIERLKGK